MEDPSGPRLQRSTTVNLFDAKAELNYYLLAAGDLPSLFRASLSTGTWIARRSSQPGFITITYLSASQPGVLTNYRVAAEPLPDLRRVLHKLGLRFVDWLGVRLLAELKGIDHQLEPACVYLRSPNLQSLAFVPRLWPAWDVLDSPAAASAAQHMPKVGMGQQSWAARTLYGVTGEQRLAFAMGKHARLGADSPVRWLPKDVIRYIFGRFLDPARRHGIHIQFPPSVDALRGLLFPLLLHRAGAHLRHVAIECRHFKTEPLSVWTLAWRHMALPVLVPLLPRWAELESLDLSGVSLAFLAAPSDSDLSTGLLPSILDWQRTHPLQSLQLCFDSPACLNRFASHLRSEARDFSSLRRLGLQLAEPPKAPAKVDCPAIVAAIRSLPALHSLRLASIGVEAACTLLAVWQQWCGPGAALEEFRLSCNWPKSSVPPEQGRELEALLAKMLVDRTQSLRVLHLEDDLPRFVLPASSLTELGLRGVTHRRLFRDFLALGADRRAAFYSDDAPLFDQSLYFQNWPE